MAKKILFADDDPDLLFMISLGLKKRGYRWFLPGVSRSAPY
jgi:DNA-binding response OmpR family regulator